MIVGHFAVALGAKKLTPQLSLGVLFVACQIADILAPPLALLGIEAFDVKPGITVMMPLDLTNYPYSHSLVALTAWSVSFALLYMWLGRAGKKPALVLAVLGVSHWILDALMHRPDLPITLTGPTRVGLGLWNHPVVGVPLELLLFAAGVWIYVRQTHALNRRGSVGLWALVLFLLAVYTVIHFGPPLQSADAVAWSGQAALWLIIAWGFWVDRNRAVTIDGLPVS